MKSRAFTLGSSERVVRSLSEESRVVIGNLNLPSVTVSVFTVDSIAVAVRSEPGAPGDLNGRRELVPRQTAIIFVFSAEFAFSEIR